MGSKGRPGLLDIFLNQLLCIEKLLIMSLFLITDTKMSASTELAFLTSMAIWFACSSLITATQQA